MSALYPKKSPAIDRKAAILAAANYFLGLIACILLLFGICYAMVLCVDIPVFFTDGQYAAFFLIELGALCALSGKCFLNLKRPIKMRHGIVTAVFSLIALLIWFILLIHDFSAMSTQLEAAFRFKVLMMDVVGLVIALAGVISQLFSLLQGRHTKRKEQSR